MKFVVIGGSGLIGKQVVASLSKLGHEVVSASPSAGVNAVTGEGLATAFAGARVVIDVSNSPSFADKEVLEFFERSGTNIGAAERAAGVAHHVALSVVGADRLPDAGYMRAKVAQETLIKASGIPYTILRATQFFEFLGAIVGAAAASDGVHLTSARLQPVAAADVARAVVDLALAPPTNGTHELAGPEALPLDEPGRRYLKSKQDARTVITDNNAGYFGAIIDDRSLTPGNNPRLGGIHLDEWLSQSRP